MDFLAETIERVSLGIVLPLPEERYCVFDSFVAKATKL
jgi:hypothetical protein